MLRTTKPLILSFITHQFLIVSTAQVAELAPDRVTTSQLTACGVNDTGFSIQRVCIHCMAFIHSAAAAAASKQ